MRERDMDPDELQVFEEEIVQSEGPRDRSADDLSGARSDRKAEVGREVDRDDDGLPDKPAKYRVPS